MTEIELLQAILDRLDNMHGFMWGAYIALVIIIALGRKN